MVAKWWPNGGQMVAMQQTNYRRSSKMELITALALGLALQLEMTYNGTPAEVQTRELGFDHDDTVVVLWPMEHDTADFGTVRVYENKAEIHWYMRATEDSIWHVDSTTVHPLTRKLRKLPPMVPTMPRMIALQQPVRLATCFENQYGDCWGK
jgi:hypothetical protein